MEINTKYFGRLPFSEEEAVLFDNGLFGFEEYRRFLLIRFENDNDSLFCLQSLENEELSFIVMNPFVFLPEYAPELSETELEAIGASAESVAFYNICVLRDNIEESTVNLRCPLIISPNTRKAKQVILDNDNYSFKLSFSSFLKKEEN